MNQVEYLIKKYYYKEKRILHNPLDWKYHTIKTTQTSKGLIVLVHESEKLGASYLMLNIARELNKLGIDIYIISQYCGPLNKEFNTFAPLTIIGNKKRYNKALKILKTNGYSHLLSNSGFNGEYIKIANENGIHSFCLFNELPEYIEKLNMKKEFKLGLEYSDKIFFPTLKCRDAIQKYMNLNITNKSVIKPQGIYNKQTHNVDSNIIIKRINQLVTWNYNKIIIGAGNTNERKGIKYFINMAELSTEEVLFIWAGKKEKYFIEEYSNKTLPKNFLYIGELSFEELNSFYMSADFLLLSSVSDTFPSVMLDAMQYGVPVAGFASSGGIEELVSDGLNGVLVRCPQEYALLLKKMCEVMADHERYLNMKKCAKETAKNYRFDDYVKFIVKKIGM